MVTTTSAASGFGGADQGGATMIRPTRTVGRSAWDRAAQFSSETRIARACTRSP